MSALETVATDGGATGGEGSSSTLDAERSRGPRKIRLTAVIAVAAAVGVVVWLLVSGSGGGSGTGNSSSTAPPHKTIAAVSQQGLQTLAGSLHGPIYWAGPHAGVKYELTQISNGETFVRYLPQSVPVGTGVPYLFVGTFAVRDAYAATLAAANRSGSVRIPAGRNAVAFYSAARPRNVYLAFAGSNYQLEIYDPNPSVARRLVTAAAIRPVSLTAPGAITPATLSVASSAGLQVLPAQVGHVVYWAGPSAHAVYEVTRTSLGAVFVRYLAPGAALGTATHYPFVGTLPVGNAYAATVRAASAPGAIKLPVGSGAIAFYSNKLPTNVFMASPGSKYQIEVYDPVASRAAAEVRAGSIRALP